MNSYHSPVTIPQVLPNIGSNRNSVNFFRDLESSNSKTDQFLVLPFGRPVGLPTGKKIRSFNQVITLLNQINQEIRKEITYCKQLDDQADIIDQNICSLLKNLSQFKRIYKKRYQK
ncbi:Hypothetical_protein [Hexamita inflata]|uniref:Hypothetical_protein n=1 Tax=Hexamita inflata TaxID=28002 RepID=A0AA86PYI6_9EUKA|nr:Hypothetical protein HINF_LOCUS34092 [Hexamita inflata]